LLPSGHQDYAALFVCFPRWGVLVDPLELSFAPAASGCAECVRVARV
jgi:hypothetical protein